MGNSPSLVSLFLRPAGNFLPVEEDPLSRTLFFTFPLFGIDCSMAFPHPTVFFSWFRLVAFLPMPVFFPSLPTDMKSVYPLFSNSIFHFSLFFSDSFEISNRPLGSNSLFRFLPLFPKNVPATLHLHSRTFTVSFSASFINSSPKVSLT